MDYASQTEPGEATPQTNFVIQCLQFIKVSNNIITNQTKIKPQEWLVTWSPACVTPMGEKTQIM